MRCFLLTIKGIVQGVGFRPFVYNLAKETGIKGYIKNTSGGLSIKAEGAAIIEFIDAIRHRHPPLARIDHLEITELPSAGFDDFTIEKSSEGGSFTLVPADVSVCSECLKELMDPLDRRYLYPFINCTNCGPRYSITCRIPYDRPNTTMALFSMCIQCEREYYDPLNRRFHAQPNACPVCGPVVKLTLCNSRYRTDSGDPISGAIDLLKQGAVIAVKGLGGFHLCCDALNGQAVQRLRRAKRKSNKPFALMAPDCRAVGSFCEISPEDSEMLGDARRPIVLLKRKAIGGSSCLLPHDVAPGNKYLGFMLPYTPLHYLLFHYPDSGGKGGANFDALVMTSGNFADEPIVIDNTEADGKFSGIADALLLHNRDIFMRVDDSVVRPDQSSPALRPPGSGASFTFIRRSRGFVPESIVLEGDGPEVLGCGADVKNTFCIIKDNYAVVSQHMGDMENLETLLFFEEALSNLSQAYSSEPAAYAYDLHPGYMSTSWAKKQIRTRNLFGYGVQHHYAHIASVMAENRLKGPVIGIALDGTGYGTDGTLWGGEFLVCSISGFSRAAHFSYIPLPGGERSIKECWRTAIGAAAAASAGDRDVMAVLEETGFTDKYGTHKIKNILKIASNRNFSPLSSGAGRLFDAVSALTGICDRNTFEGEAAIALENEIEQDVTESYVFKIRGCSPAILDFSETLFQVISDLKSGVAKGRIAARFHNTIIEAIVSAAAMLKQGHGTDAVALSGGVFQNSYIFERAFSALASSGFRVYTNINVPCNDACISLGQAFLLRERLRAGLPLED